jgi:hexosaminidase
MSYRIKYNEKWKSTGDVALIDNFRGDVTVGDRWQGFEVNEMDVTIDLKKLMDVESVTVGCLQLPSSWIFLPNYIEVFTSVYGENFEPAGRIETIKEWQRLDSKKADMRIAFPKANCLYIRVFAKNIKYNPEWHYFSGGEAWLFVDEIIIN